MARDFGSVLTPACASSSSPHAATKHEKDYGKIVDTSQELALDVAAVSARTQFYSRIHSYPA